MIKVSRGKQHAGNRKFLHAVGVGSRRIEYDNALIRAFLNRDIIVAGTRPRYCEQPLRQLQLMHCSAAHKHRVRLRQIIRRAERIRQKLHRTVGGMRASIYNAMPLEGVEKLVAFMRKFEAENPVK